MASDKARRVRDEARSAARAAVPGLPREQAHRIADAVLEAAAVLVPMLPTASDAAREDRRAARNDEMRRRRQAGWTVDGLADAYGVSTRQVYRIVKGPPRANQLVIGDKRLT